MKKKYEKQVPVIGSGKKLNMEIEPKRNNSLRNLPLMFYTAVENNIEGGNIPNFQDENTDAERYKNMELMGAGGEEEEPEIHIERNIGGSKKSNKKTITNINTNVKKVVEVVEGSDVAKEHKEEQPRKKAGRPKKTVEIEAPPVVKKSRGRPKKQTIVEAPEIVETEIIGSGNGSMIQRRGNLIKKVMKEQGLSLIQASKHIKEKGLKY